MMEDYIAELSYDQKYSLKEQLQAGFPDGEIVLNAMAFLYDKDRGVVTVEGLYEGDAIDGLEFSLPDFVDMVNAVLADVVIYETEEEEAEALRTYLTDLSAEDKRNLLKKLPKMKNGRSIKLARIGFLYDDERNTVVVDVHDGYKTIDVLELPLIHFLAVVKEVVGDVEVAG